MASTLPKQSGSSARNCYAYHGDREGWSVALTVTRDSDALERSNWEVITEDVLAVPDDTEPCNQHETIYCTCNHDGLPDAAIERDSHWACGWVDKLLVRPGSSAERRALEWADKLADYPVADEEHCGMLEWQEDWCVRCDRGMRSEHGPDNTLYYGSMCTFRSAGDADEIRWRWRRRNGR